MIIRYESSLKFNHVYTFQINLIFVNSQQTTATSKIVVTLFSVGTEMKAVMQKDFKENNFC